MKDPLTPAGIEPATFRFVAQHLNHCATAVPSNCKKWKVRGGEQSCTTLQIPFLSPSIVTVMKMKRVRHAPLMWKVVNAHKMSVQKCHSNRTFGKEKHKDVTAVPKWILKNWGLVGGGSKLSWFRDRYGGRLFGKFVFDKRRITWPAELLSALQEELCSTKFDTALLINYNAVRTM